MKTTLTVATAAAAACLMMPCLGIAAPNDNDKNDLRRDPDRFRESRDSQDRGSMTNHIQRFGRSEKASQLLGREVSNLRNEKLGKIEEMAIDLDSARVVWVVVSVGGFLGIGDTLVEVPPQALRSDAANKLVRLDSDKEKLQGAPKFSMDQWDKCCTDQQVKDGYRYYGQEPFSYHGDPVVPDSLAQSTDSKRSADTQDSKSTTYVTRAMKRLGPASRASKLIGTSVRNHQDESVGKVDNLLVDLTSGRLLGAVVGSGGFLGLGEELSFIPTRALSFDSQRDILLIDTSKEALSKAPHFKSSEWPDLDQPDFAEGAYRSYGYPPYFNDAAPDKDNSAQNVRDRDGRTVTPLDQSNKSEDIAITARIRKDIMAEKVMSVNARNVKITTANGRVTLRGTVNSAEEKNRIAEIARTVATSDQVDDQVEVKVRKNQQ